MNGIFLPDFGLSTFVSNLILYFTSAWLKDVPQVFTILKIISATFFFLMFC